MKMEREQEEVGRQMLADQEGRQPQNINHST
jgi:hypothetical protein